MEWQRDSLASRSCVPRNGCRLLRSACLRLGRITIAAGRQDQVCWATIEDYVSCRMAHDRLEADRSEAAGDAAGETDDAFPPCAGSIRHDLDVPRFDSHLVPRRGRGIGRLSVEPAARQPSGGVIHREIAEGNEEGVSIDDEAEEHPSKTGLEKAFVDGIGVP